MLFLLVASVAALNSWLCANGLVIPAAGIQAILDNARLGVMPFKRFYSGSVAMGDTQRLVDRGWANAYEFDMGLFQRGSRGQIRVITDDKGRFLGVVDHNLGQFGNGFGICAELTSGVIPTQQMSLASSVLQMNDLNIHPSPSNLIANFVYQFCLAVLTWQGNFNQLPKLGRRLVSRFTCPPNTFYNIYQQSVTTPVADDFSTVDLGHYNYIGRLMSSDPNTFNSYYGKCQRVSGIGMQCDVIRRSYQNSVIVANLKSTCSIATLGNTNQSGGIKLTVKYPGTSTNGDCSGFLTAAVV